MDSLKLVVLMVLCMGTSCLAISCFVCNSAQDENCLEPHPDYLRNCNDGSSDRNFTICRKTTIEVEGQPEKSRVIRSCGYDEAKLDCYSKNGYGTDQYICSCATDACNGAQDLHVKLPILSIITLLPLVLKNLF